MMHDLLIKYPEDIDRRLHTEVEHFHINVKLNYKAKLILHKEKYTPLL